MFVLKCWCWDLKCYMNVVKLMWRGEDWPGGGWGVVCGGGGGAAVLRHVWLIGGRRGPRRGEDRGELPRLSLDLLNILWQNMILSWRDWNIIYRWLEIGINIETAGQGTGRNYREDRWSTGDCRWWPSHLSCLSCYSSPPNGLLSWCVTVQCISSWLTLTITQIGSN